MADICPGIIYSILWVLLVIFIAWPVAGIVACIYVFLLPFAACITPLENGLDALLVVIKLPLIWSKKCVKTSGVKDENILTAGNFIINETLKYLPIAPGSSNLDKF
ncbi:hypothetical protein ACTXT7_005418 [Hymenolepis weldensis]